MTLIGTHVATGSRTGYRGTLHRGVVSYEHGAIDKVIGQVQSTCYTVMRYIDQWGDGEADIPPGFNNFSIEQAKANARFWWFDTDLRDQWRARPASAYQLTNEYGTTKEEFERLVAFENEFVELNKKDNEFTFVLMSCAGDSPHWDDGVWQDVVAPFLLIGWEAGHIYGRHAYCDAGENPKNYLIGVDGLPSNLNVERPFTEIDYMRVTYGTCGPIILTEAGWVTFPLGEEQHVTNQYKLFSDYIVQSGYAAYIGFFATFTYGKWWKAQQETISPFLNPLLEQNPYDEWVPEHTYLPPRPPIDPPPSNENPSFDNPCFSNGWETIAEGNQEPHGWDISWLENGELTPWGEPVTRWPEIVHKLSGQLPPDEQLGGENALILCGDAVYKLFGSGIWDATLSTVLTGLTPGNRYKITGQFNVHYHDEYNAADDMTIEFRTAESLDKLQSARLIPEKWVTATVEGKADISGFIDLSIRFYMRWPNSISVFVDNMLIELVEEIPPVSNPKIVIVKKPQISEMTNEENIEVSNWAFANYGRTATHSNDDMMRMLSGGNDESYAVVWCSSILL